MKTLGLALVVFMCTVIADIAWTRYTLAVTQRRPHVAAAWSAAIILIGAVTVIAYTDNPLYVLPAAAGAYVGTWLAVRK